jgi:predicted ABC-type ATPase
LSPSGAATAAARWAGKIGSFDVRLYYIGLKSVEINIERVAQRVAKGGHHIDESDIRRRYSESLKNLPRAMELANSGKIFNNDNQHTI